MHKHMTPRRISMMEMVSSNNNWNEYSQFHDSFLEMLSYENQKLFNSDIWKLNYI